MRHSPFNRLSPKKVKQLLNEKWTAEELDATQSDDRQDRLLATAFEVASTVANDPTIVIGQPVTPQGKPVAPQTGSAGFGQSAMSNVEVRRLAAQILAQPKKRNPWANPPVVIETESYQKAWLKQAEFVHNHLASSKEQPLKYQTHINHLSGLINGASASGPSSIEIPGVDFKNGLPQTRVLPKDQRHQLAYMLVETQDDKEHDLSTFVAMNAAGLPFAKVTYHETKGSERVTFYNQSGQVETPTADLYTRLSAIVDQHEKTLITLPDTSLDRRNILNKQLDTIRKKIAKDKEDLKTAFAQAQAKFMPAVMAELAVSLREQGLESPHVQWSAVTRLAQTIARPKLSQIFKKLIGRTRTLLGEFLGLLIMFLFKFLRHYGLAALIDVKADSFVQIFNRAKEEHKKPLMDAWLKMLGKEVKDGRVVDAERPLPELTEDEQNLLAQYWSKYLTEMVSEDEKSAYHDENKRFRLDTEKYEAVKSLRDKYARNHPSDQRVHDTFKTAEEAMSQVSTVNDATNIRQQQEAKSTLKIRQKRRALRLAETKTQKDFAQAHLEEYYERLGDDVAIAVRLNHETFSHEAISHTWTNAQLKSVFGEKQLQLHPHAQDDDHTTQSFTDILRHSLSSKTTSGAYNAILFSVHMRYFPNTKTPQIEDEVNLGFQMWEQLWNEEFLDDKNQPTTLGKELANFDASEITDQTYRQLQRNYQKALSAYYNKEMKDATHLINDDNSTYVSTLLDAAQKAYKNGDATYAEYFAGNPGNKPTYADYFFNALAKNPAAVPQFTDIDPSEVRLILETLHIPVTDMFGDHHERSLKKILNKQMAATFEKIMQLRAKQAKQAKLNRYSTKKHTAASTKINIEIEALKSKLSGSVGKILKTLKNQHLYANNKTYILGLQDTIKHSTTTAQSCRTKIQTLKNRLKLDDKLKGQGYSNAVTVPSTNLPWNTVPSTNLPWNNQLTSQQIEDINDKIVALQADLDVAEEAIRNEAAELQTEIGKECNDYVNTLFNGDNRSGDRLNLQSLPINFRTAQTATLLEYLNAEDQDRKNHAAFLNMHINIDGKETKVQAAIEACIAKHGYVRLKDTNRILKAACRTANKVLKQQQAKHTKDVVETVSNRFSGKVKLAKAAYYDPRTGEISFESVAYQAASENDRTTLENAVKHFEDSIQAQVAATEINYAHALQQILGADNESDLKAALLAGAKFAKPAEDGDYTEAEAIGLIKTDLEDITESKPSVNKLYSVRATIQKILTNNLTQALTVDNTKLETIQQEYDQFKPLFDHFSTRFLQTNEAQQGLFKHAMTDFPDELSWLDRANKLNAIMDLIESDTFSKLTDFEQRTFCKRYEQKISVIKSNASDEEVSIDEGIQLLKEELALFAKTKQSITTEDITVKLMSDIELNQPIREFIVDAFHEDHEASSQHPEMTALENYELGEDQIEDLIKELKQNRIYGDMSEKQLKSLINANIQQMNGNAKIQMLNKVLLSVDANLMQSLRRLFPDVNTKSGIFSLQNEIFSRKPHQLTKQASVRPSYIILVENLYAGKPITETDINFFLFRNKNPSLNEAQKCYRDTLLAALNDPKIMSTRNLKLTSNDKYVRIHQSVQNFKLASNKKYTKSTSKPAQNDRPGFANGTQNPLANMMQQQPPGQSATDIKAAERRRTALKRSGTEHPVRPGNRGRIQ